MPDPRQQDLKSRLPKQETKYKSVRWILADLQCFEDSKFASKTTKFYAKWPIRNFWQKREFQYLEKSCYLKLRF